MRQTENIYNTTLKILNEANSLQITPQEAALNVAQDRINKAKNN